MKVWGVSFLFCEVKLMLKRRNGGNGSGKVTDLRTILGKKGSSKQEQEKPDPFEGFRIYEPGSTSRKKLTVGQVAAAIIENEGYMMKTAAALRVSHKTLWQYVKDHPTLRDLINDVTELTLDFAEAKLKELMAARNLQAIMFHLKCKGRHRGWVENVVEPPKERKPIMFTMEEVAPLTEENGNGNDNRVDFPTGSESAGPAPAEPTAAVQEASAKEG